MQKILKIKNQLLFQVSKTLLLLQGDFNQEIFEIAIISF